MFNGEYTAISVTKEVVKNNELYLSVSIFPSINLLTRHFRNQKETGTSFFFGQQLPGLLLRTGKNLANSWPRAPFPGFGAPWGRGCDRRVPGNDPRSNLGHISAPDTISFLRSHWEQKCKRKTSWKTFNALLFIYSLYLLNNHFFLKASQFYFLRQMICKKSNTQIY